MTQKDKQDIAKYIAEELKNHEPKITCPHGIDAETAASLKEFGQTWKIGKKTLTVTFFSGIAAGLGGLIVLGIIAKVKSWV
jgi:hypothetical protein